MKEENKILNSSLKKMVTRFGREDFVSAIVKNSSKDDITKLPLDELTDSHYLKKAKLDETKITQAKKQMREQGFYDPVIVRTYQNKYEVVVGRVKYQAAKELKLESIDVVILNLSEEETLLFMLKEIKDRKTLNIYELTIICNALKNNFNYKNKELADFLDQSSSQISNLLQIIELPQEVLNDLSSNIITYGHAKAISRLDNKNLLIAFNKIKDEHLSVRDTEKLVRDLKGIKKDIKVDTDIDNDASLDIKFNNPLETTLEFKDLKIKGKVMRKLNGYIKKGKVVIK